MQCQHRVKVFLSRMILEPYQEYRTIIWIILEAPTVLHAPGGQRMGPVKPDVDRSPGAYGCASTSVRGLQVLEAS